MLPLFFVLQVLDLPKESMPLVHSMSYGNDEVQQSSLAFMLECNTQVSTTQRPSCTTCVRVPLFTWQFGVV